MVVSKLRVVIDPGVLVSAALVPGGKPDQLLRAWQAGQFEMLVSLKLLSELDEVLGREKFRHYLSAEEASEFVAYLRTEATLCLDPDVTDPVTVDPDDDYLFALARTHRANCLVSGDGHLLNIEAAKPPVLSPAALVERLAHESGPR